MSSAQRLEAGLHGLTLTERMVDVGEVRLHVVEASPEGPEENAGVPLVVLLHGFPEHWYSWHLQIPALVGAGYRVVAPDMRGYTTSDKPRGVGAYVIERLVGDVSGLVRACGAERAVVVGHDWGAVVAWSFAMAHPEQVERLAICNGPHPLAMLRALRTWAQLRRSWYIGLFQIPWVAEWFLRRGDFRVVRDTFRGQARRSDTLRMPDVERYVEAIAHPGALTAALNYYRGLLRLTPARLRSVRRPVRAPVLVVWGEQDVALGIETADPGRELAPHFELVRIPDGSHWITLDKPREVNEALLRFLATPDHPPADPLHARPTGGPP